MATCLKGIGDTALRQNEILPSFDARINRFILGQNVGVIKNELAEFSIELLDRGVIIGTGMAVAFGFFGLSDTATQFNFIMPVTTNYVHIYAEIDLTLIPNRFSIKASEMSGNQNFSYQKDDLLSANGKYQIPLYMLTLTKSSITINDNRTYIYGTTAQNHTTIGGIFDSLELRLPKLTKIFNQELITITADGSGGQEIIPLTKIEIKDNIFPVGLFIANIEVMSALAESPNMSGIIDFFGNSANISVTIPSPTYKILDSFNCSFELRSSTRVYFNGKPWTRLQNGNLTFNQVIYSLNSMYRINFD